MGTTFIQRRINADATSWRCMDANTTLYKKRVIWKAPLASFINFLWNDHEYNSEHSSRRAKRVANEVSSTVENMIKEK